MRIEFSKKFMKRYKKLKTNQQKKIDHTLALFKIDPTSSRLKSHKLRGGMKKRQAISAGGDLRLIFEEHKNYTLVLFLDVGSHNQVY